MSWIPSNKIMDPVVDVLNVVCSIGKPTRRSCAGERGVVGRCGQKLVRQCEDSANSVSRERLGHAGEVLRRSISQQI
jgi:hypothetical protein